MPNRLTRMARPLVAAVSVALLSAALIATPGAASSGVSLSTVLTGYSRPVLVTAPRGNSRKIWIVEQTGKIKLATYSHGRWQKIGTFLDVRDLITYDGHERGLLGLAFAPDYGHGGKLYINYTRKRDGATVVAETGRLTHNANRACKSCLRKVISISQPYSNHNGGMMAFGPDDLLYIGTGDGGSGDDPGDRAQSLGSRLGKILRIDPHDPKGAAHYSVPDDNPFLDTPGAKPEIWVRGLRNPWRWSFDRKTHDLWIGDVGQSAREEVDKSDANSSGRNAGRKVNFGWDRCEGRVGHEGSCVGLANYEAPVDDYDHSKGCAVTGGYVYRGPDYSHWQGRYVFADYCSGRLWVTSNSGHVIGPGGGVQTGRNISAFGEDGAGRLYATDLSGRILRVKFSGTP